MAKKRERVFIDELDGHRIYFVIKHGYFTATLEDGLPVTGARIDEVEMQIVNRRIKELKEKQPVLFRRYNGEKYTKGFVTHHNPENKTVVILHGRNKSIKQIPGIDILVFGEANKERIKRMEEIDREYHKLHMRRDKIYDSLVMFNIKKK